MGRLVDSAALLFCEREKKNICICVTRQVNYNEAKDIAVIWRWGGGRALYIQ